MPRRPAAPSQLRWTRWLRIFLLAGRQWSADNAFSHSSAVSFNTLFSLAPITVITATLVGWVVGKEKASSAMHDQLAALVGPDSAKMIQETSEKATAATHGSWYMTALAIGLLLFGATTVFGQLQDSLNSIWKVKQKPSESGWLVLITQRLLSFAMVLTVGFLLLVSLILTTAMEGLTQHFLAQQDAVFLKVIDLGVSVVVITTLFALLLKIMPDVEVRWAEVWRSGAVTAALFTIGRYGIALYLAHSNVASVYGSAGSLVALLIWIYYSSAIFFYGAEFVKADRQIHHHAIRVKATAVKA